MFEAVDSSHISNADFGLKKYLTNLPSGREHVDSRNSPKQICALLTSDECIQADGSCGKPCVPD